MGRSAQFDAAGFVRAAQSIIAGEGVAGLSIQKVAARSGATSGSVYHRFESLDQVAMLAWLDAAEDFQAAFGVSIQQEDTYAAVLSGALHTPAWCRVNLIRAQVLLRFRPEDLPNPKMPEELEKRRRLLTKDLRRSTLRLYRRSGKTSAAHRQLLQFLLVDMPLAAVKPHLQSGRKPPTYVDDFIQKSIQGFRSELS